MRPFACLLILFGANPIFAQEASWVAKTIITKRLGIKIHRIDPRGKLIYTGALIDSLDYRVVAEKDGQIKVVTTQGVEGWFDKRDAVPFEDAAEHFTQMLKLDPDNAGAYQKRSFVWEKQGKFDSALKDIDEAIRLAPYDMAGWNSRGILRSVQKEYDLAIRDLSLAIRFNPNHAAGYANRGAVWTAKKEYDKAITDLDRALKIEPKSAYVYNQRGLAWCLKKAYGKALDDFDKAAELDAEDAQVHKNRARLLATSADAKYRDGKKAVEYANRALALEKNPDVDFHETLAAAYAEAGMFTLAILWQNRAVQDLQRMNDAEARARLEQYRQKKAYRQD